MQYRAMTLNDYDAAVELWKSAEGVRLRDADSREGIGAYLSRNPGLSFIAEAEGKIVGTIMAGHDGKRGYIQHLSVEASRRRRGIGRKLASLCLEALKQEGILKSHLMILVENETGRQFWSSLGWKGRPDIELYSFINGGSQNT
jgi:ribosomal protein S18 acetylase RimI-like enzyme